MSSSAAATGPLTPDSLTRPHVVPNSAKPGSSQILRHPLAADDLVQTTDPDMKTCYEAMLMAVGIYADRPFLGQRPFDKNTGTFGGFEWITYAEAWETAKLLGSGMMALYDRAHPPEQSSSTSPSTSSSTFNVGIYAPNRPEWRISELACVCYNCPSVALYDTLGPDSVHYILDHSQVPVVVASFDKIADILRVANKLPLLKVLVCMDEWSDVVGRPVKFLIKDWAASLGIVIVDWKEVLELGKASAAKYPHVPPTEDDLATICYSSGTSGTPSGCLIYHRNVVAGATAAIVSDMIPDGLELVLLSYLPLAHVYGRGSEVMVMILGGRIGYWCNDHTRLIEDLQMLKPTIFPSVPRVLNRIYDRIIASTVEAPRLRGVICRKAFGDKLANLKAGLGNKHRLWDTIIFSQVRAVLGGRIELIISGSAPIDQKVLDVLRVALVCTVVEGYGQTESSSVTSFTRLNEFKAGHVGIPAPCCEVKLVDVTEMGYLVTDKPHPRGEICIRGNNVFGGYYRNEAKTRETLDEDGWLHSGDIGRINDDGTISIIDRKKALIKLAQGEYVATEAVENVYSLSTLVEQMYVHGNSLESQLVAIIVPDEDSFVAWSRKLVHDTDVRKALLKELDKIGKEHKLGGFEQVKAIRIESEMMSIENGLFTPTMKIKRHECAKYYARQIKEMYDELRAITPKSYY
ncbi:acetyl-CoA synthetase-like protein [Ramicandelaber brevisporus]|nr:acetyl-CoA synthetase-like protein [Ramicandelaber brevisporus]